MTLLIDVGNTRIKWVLQATQMSGLDKVQVALSSEPLSEELKQAIQRADTVWISCVASSEMKAQLALACAKHLDVHWVQASEELLGLKSAYQPPASLGADRWCGLQAVWKTYKKTALIVSIGTAMTIDALLVKTNTRATFLGGSIQPGLQMMLDGLNQGTAQLPRVKGLTWDGRGFANNTDFAMQAGCIQAALGAIQLQYQALSEVSEQKPMLVLTGGGALQVNTYLPKSLAQVSVFVDNLALLGLTVLAGIA